MIKLLIVIVVVLGVIAIAQLAKVYELTAKLRNAREENISQRENKMNATLLLVFMFALYAFVIWHFIKYGDGGLPDSASLHGQDLDALLNFNWVIIIAVFFLTNTLLFYFAYKYYHRPDRKAYYFPHNNKLELIWTVIPAVVLAVIIIYGLRVWNDVTDEASEDAIVIELYSKQFDWTARYGGMNDLDGLGDTDYNLVSGTNPLGIITKQNIADKYAELDEQVKELEHKIEHEKDIMSDRKLGELTDKLEHLKRHRSRVFDIRERSNNNEYTYADDDILVKGEFHIPKGKEVLFIFRSQDVIHSAYMPHFRAQMNTVPGMTTQFKMVPIISTDSMRIKLDDPSFNYVLLCNKICGAAHFNMQMDIVVDEYEDYKKWLEEQGAPAEEADATTETAKEEESTAGEDKPADELAEN